MQKIAEIIDDNTIHVYDLTQFNIDAIMHSGQVFRYFESVNGYDVVVGNNFAEIIKEDNRAVIKCNNARFFWSYFDLDTNYNVIKEQLLKYHSIKKIFETSNAGGIRILRAEFIETVISFIVSANNNIKRFTKTLNQLCEQFGTKLENGFFAFPTLEQLNNVTVSDFRALGCGYRSEHLVKAISQLGQPHMQMEKLCKLDNYELSKTLQTLFGVGQKVAFCVMLFCGDFHRLDLAPQDTWIIKALNQLPKEDKEILLNHKYAGVAQQYIFYYLQHLKKELN
ncbi:MAG: hypothetical protein FWE45_03560 [Firmicutes bacterium]|nr:hypothetical protein [Bacillota bacterium]